MDREEHVRSMSPELERISPPTHHAGASTQGLPWQMDHEFSGGRARWDLSLEEIEKSLASAYLATNLNQGEIPLKKFLSDIERQILLVCLDQTRGSQKDAAAILGLKPTALFEKIRKHYINSKHMKLSRRLAIPAAGR